MLTGRWRISSTLKVEMNPGCFGSDVDRGVRAGRGFGGEGGRLGAQNADAASTALGLGGDNAELSE